MKTRISSFGTVIQKVIEPSILLLIAIGFIISIVTNPKPIFDLIYYIILLIGFGIISYFYGFKLKNVWFFDDKLIIRSFFQEIIVEKWEISKISQNLPGLIPRFIIINLKYDTKFGKRILFIPRGGFYIYWNHKIVVDLLEWKDE